MQQSDYERFGNGLLDSCKAHFQNSEYSEPQNGEYKVLNLSNKMSLRFLAWGNKPYYLILFLGNKYLFELELIKIFKLGSKYTWYLSKPRNTKNVKVLDKKLQYHQEIDYNYRSHIKGIKKHLNAGQVVYKEGYLLVENENWSNLTDKFLEILPLIIYEHLSSATIQRQDLIFDLDDQEALEGYKADKKYLHKQRNQTIVRARKLKDDYTCQVCGFKLNLNNKYIIECHHLYPIGLGYERVTAIDDLICLCPTCHRIAHTREYPYNIGEMKKMINDINKNESRTKRITCRYVKNKKEHL